MPIKGELRNGWTTGACAAAAAKAAFCALVTGHFPNPVQITLPRGQQPSFILERSLKREDWAEAGIVKDSGDDPDVTHGAVILARIRRLLPGNGIRFVAGPGVGTITKPGLPLAPGEPAINPAPRTMIQAMITEVASAYNTHPDAEVTISVPGGIEIAKQTWNGRLGIVGGISILGTTGIVHPYSCSAWIASIHRGIDVIRAAGHKHAGAATGSTTEAALTRLYRLREEQIIDMGDFAGGMLKYLRSHPIDHVTIALGFGKGVKLADGFSDLHSSRSQVNLVHLADWAETGGAPTPLIEKIRSANTAMEAQEAASNLFFPLGTIVAARAQSRAQEICGQNSSIEILLFNRAGAQVS